MSETGEVKFIAAQRKGRVNVGENQGIYEKLESRQKANLTKGLSYLAPPWLAKLIARLS